jgi:hypothetical protein
MGLSDSRYTCLHAATDCYNEILTLLAISAAGSADHGEQSMKGTSFGILLLAFGTTCVSTWVLADDLLGFYVGAAIGESHVRTAKEILGDTDYDYEFDQQHSAWKVTAGIRPISPLGVELEYIDFGNPSAGIGTSGASPDLISLGVTWTF